MRRWSVFTAVLAASGFGLGACGIKGNVRPGAAQAHAQAEPAQDVILAPVHPPEPGPSLVSGSPEARPFPSRGCEDAVCQGVGDAGTAPPGGL